VTMRVAYMDQLGHRSSPLVRPFVTIHNKPATPILIAINHTHPSGDPGTHWTAKPMNTPLTIRSQPHLSVLTIPALRQDLPDILPLEWGLIKAVRFTPKFSPDLYLHILCTVLRPPLMSVPRVTVRSAEHCSALAIVYLGPCLRSVVLSLL